MCVCGFLSSDKYQTRVKRTKLDKMLNRAIGLVLIMLTLVCLVGLIGMAVNVSDNVVNHPYLGWTDGAAVAAMLNFLTYWILFSGMVPISLYVSVEMIKVLQALLIDNDVKMYHEASDTPAKAKTSALSEELGQISYIFSDKTGTLTRNEMEFKKCCVGGKSYGLMEEEAKDVPPLRSAVDQQFGFRDRDIENDLAKGPRAALLQDFMTTLSVCHTVLVEHEKGHYAYNAESPDEAALVNAAQQFGWVFAERVTTAEGSFLTVKTQFVNGRESTRREPLRYLLLNVIEFNSTRKRMSVVVREMFGARRLILMTKGADNVITGSLFSFVGLLLSDLFRKGLLAKGQDKVLAETNVYVNEYAQVGLRTLFIANRILDENWYGAWSVKYHAASTAIDNREQLVAEVCVEMERVRSCCFFEF